MSSSLPVSVTSDKDRSWQLLAERDQAELVGTPEGVDA